MGKLFTGKIRWLINFFIILLVGFGLFLVTVYNGSLKQLTVRQFNIVAGKVLGDKIALPEVEGENPKEKQKEALVYAVAGVKSAAVPLVGQLMQIRIGDIVSSYIQINHFVHDTQALREFAMEKLREFAQ